MKLTIIPIDSSVCEDGVSYSGLTWEGTPVDVHALQWDNGSGWIEFNDGTPNQEITELPQWALNAEAAWATADYNAKNPPAPTPEQIQAGNKNIAVSLLQQTDWATIADISNPSVCNPYLTNPADFIAFRNQVRSTAINPPTTSVTFPAIPTALWSS